MDAIRGSQLMGLTIMAYFVMNPFNTRRGNIKEYKGCGNPQNCVGIPTGPSAILNFAEVFFGLPRRMQECNYSHVTTAPPQVFTVPQFRMAFLSYSAIQPHSTARQHQHIVKLLAHSNLRLSTAFLDSRCFLLYRRLLQCVLVCYLLTLRIQHFTPDALLVCLDSHYITDVDHWIYQSYIPQAFIHTLNLGVCILLRVLDQVQGFPSNATLFQ
jgi:hypothetical protein